MNLLYYIQRKLITNNRTPLHIAAEKNSKEIGEILILNGADINAKTKITVSRSKKPWLSENDVDGQTPLHYAAEKNATRIGELLISKGANINAINIISLYMKNFI